MMSDHKPSRFEQWIFDSFHISAEGLALYRIFAALFILLYALPQTEMYSFLGSLPQAFFAPPPGPMMLFDTFPSAGVLLTMHYLLVGSLIFMLFGVFTKYSSLASGVLLLILKGFIYSLGKVNHEMLLMVVLLIMAFSGWGSVYSVDYFRKKAGRSKPQSWTLTLLALIMGFMFFTAGFPKILGGWLNPFTQAVQGHYFRQYFVHGRQDLLAPYASVLPAAVWELFDYATVLFEVGFLAAVLYPRSTRFFVCLAVLFHFGTMMLLNIAFLPNFVAYAAFLNWDWIDEKIKQRGAKFSLPRVERTLLAIMTVAFGMFLIPLASRVLENVIHLQSDLTVVELVIVSLSVPVALYFICNQVSQLIKNNVREQGAG